MNVGAVEATKILLEGHQPKKDPAWSLIQHEYCSCGAFETYIDTDGYPTLGPAHYPCKQRLLLEELLAILEGDDGQ